MPDYRLSSNYDVTSLLAVRPAWPALCRRRPPARYFQGGLAEAPCFSPRASCGKARLIHQAAATRSRVQIFRRVAAARFSNWARLRDRRSHMMRGVARLQSGSLDDFRFALAPDRLNPSRRVHPDCQRAAEAAHRRADTVSTLEVAICVARSRSDLLVFDGGISRAACARPIREPAANVRSVYGASAAAGEALTIPRGEAMIGGCPPRRFAIRPGRKRRPHPRLAGNAQSPLATSRTPLLNACRAEDRVTPTAHERSPRALSPGSKCGGYR